MYISIYTYIYIYIQRNSSSQLFTTFAIENDCRADFWRISTKWSERLQQLEHDLRAAEVRARVGEEELESLKVRSDLDAREALECGQVDVQLIYIYI